MAHGPVPTLSVLTLFVLAGCLGTPDVDPAAVEDGVAEAVASLVFSPLTIIDDVRSGGEPVIAVTPKGTILVSAHPGWTHTTTPPSPDLVTPVEAQSYMWRSTDGGETWAPVTLAGAGPKGPWVGVSDPDFAVDAEGRVFFTDLGPLTHSAVMRSDDDGETWIMGNALASGLGPLDRQWLATQGTDAYFISNYFTEERVLKSTDGGVTWTRVGAANCGGDINADPAPGGALFIGCGNGMDVSLDGGATWTERTVPDTEQRFRTMAEPAMDAAGNLYVTWTTEDGVWYAGTGDLGDTWTTPVNLAAHLDWEAEAGRHIWPWIVAGDEGRIAVTWYAADSDADPGEVEGPWHVYAAVVTDAMGAAPEVHAARASPEPVFDGPICQNGTACQFPGPTQGDRRLGDFFESAIDLEGSLLIAVSVATGPDSVSHAGFMKQVEGPRLRN